MGSRLDRVTDWAERAREAGYQISALAAGLDVTARHLRRYLRFSFDSAPKELLRRFQMETARELLDARHSVKEVSSEVGFQHATHFSRAFKQANGVAPGEYSEVRRDRHRHNVRFRSEMSDIGLSSRLSREQEASNSSSSAKERSEQITL